MATLDIAHVSVSNYSKNNNNKYRFNPRYYFDKKYYLNPYKNAMFSKFMMINDRWICNWNIFNHTLYKLKTENMENRFIVSNIYFNM